MIPAYWHEGLPGYLWQVSLHAFVMGFIFYAWARSARLPSGRTTRWLLGLLIVLPLMTAAVPFRSSIEFRGQEAWFDSGRVLAIPLLIDGVRLYHFVLVVAVLTSVVTIWQELLPALLRTRRGPLAAPREMVELARSLPGWDRCDVTAMPAEGIVMTTSGWPGRPRLVVSRGAIDRLLPAEWQAAIRHEHAHWRPGRWMYVHVLFVLRLVQLPNPVALWAFRELCIEEEIACDADATIDRDRASLGRALLKVYRETAGRDVAARSALRKRVDVLLGGGPSDDALPAPTLGAAALVMTLVLPWIV